MKNIKLLLTALMFIAPCANAESFGSASSAAVPAPKGPGLFVPVLCTSLGTLAGICIGALSAYKYFNNPLKKHREALLRRCQSCCKPVATDIVILCHECREQGEIKAGKILESQEQMTVRGADIDSKALQRAHEVQTIPVRLQAEGGVQFYDPVAPFIYRPDHSSFQRRQDVARTLLPIAYSTAVITAFAAKEAKKNIQEGKVFLA